MTDFIRIRREGPVLCVAFNRPDKKNAILAEMYVAMLGALNEASADASIACVLISGEGGIFTAGNDIGDFLKGAMSATSADESTPGGRFIRALARFEKPIVAAVEGQAIGIGTTLCFHCDLVYAAPSARFQMPFVNLGLVPEAGSSRLATMRFGIGKASEMLLLGEAFDAQAAHEIGFVNAVMPADQLFAHAMQKAQALAAKPRAALLATRKLMRGEQDALYAHMEVELGEFWRALRSPEARDAFMAFMAKGRG